MAASQLSFTILEKSFSIHRFPPGHPIPEQVRDRGFCSITRTFEELSVVCPTDIVLLSDKKEEGWSCIQVIGPLDFSLTGILSHISGILADQGISIFSVSTFDTDYILVKSENLASARQALTNAGHFVE